MLFHFIPGVDRYAPLGSMGVRLFFVLSGFLITRILLAWRDEPLAVAVRAFYIRRSLRIFPVYYLVLFAAAAINIRIVRESLFWHAAYVSNIYFFLRADGTLTHLWSLAVEEQFYLVWPWLILCLSRATATWIILAMIPLAPLARLFIDHPMMSVLPISCLDSLGLGALLAFQASRTGIVRAGIWIGTPVLVGGLILRFVHPGGDYQEVVTDLGVSLVAVWLIGTAVTGFRGIAGAILQWRPLVYLGRISYGVYLYHGFMPYVLGRVMGERMLRLHWWSEFAILSIATVAIASVSWHGFEKPILSLKETYASRKG